MSNENVILFLEGVRKRNAAQNLVDAKMDARLKGFRLLPSSRSCAKRVCQTRRSAVS
jgi:hypothetical protein